MGSWIGQYCINVTDLDATVAFYEALGLECTSRTQIDTAGEAIVETVGKGGKVQFAQQNDQDGPLDMGNAFWKLYVNTNDIGATHAAALAAGAEEVMAPMRMEQWPTSISFVKDRDGYLVELVQRHPWLDGDDTTPVVARPVLHQRHGPRGHDRLLRDAGPDLHQPHRHRRGQGGDPGGPRQGGQGPAGPAGRPGRPHHHGDGLLEALREHR